MKFPLDFLRSHEISFGAKQNLKNIISFQGWSAKNGPNQLVPIFLFLSNNYTYTKAINKI